MIFLAVTLATFWAWEFISQYASWIPAYIVYFLVPGIAYGFYHTPTTYVYPLAACALVGLLHRLTQIPVSSTRTQVPRRRSNIPPV